MSSTPKFMIADNHMSHPENEYVYHTEKPRFLALYEETEDGSNFKIVDDIDNIKQFFGNDAEKAQDLMEELEDWWIEFNQWVEQEELDA